MLLFVIIILVWGSNWTVTKLILLSVPPIWSAAIRLIIGSVALFLVQLCTRTLIIPTKQDLPVLFVVGIFQMSLFSGLVALGLQYISVGHSVVLSYTTPLWVAPAAVLILHEPVNRLRMIGVFLGIIGVIILFNPSMERMSNTNELVGNFLLLLASFSWAVAIICIKACQWRSTPFQLVFWQHLLSAGLLSITAIIVEGVPHVAVDAKLVVQFAYSGLLATAFGYWAMIVINRSLPVIVTSLGMLATPVVGIVFSQLVLGEKIDLPLVVAGSLILTGIALGCIQPQTDRRK